MMKWFEDIDEPIRKAHAERLQAAREKAYNAECHLYSQMNAEADVLSVVMSIAELIDAKVTLALLERG